MILQNNVPTKRFASVDRPRRFGRALALAAILSVVVAGARARAEEPATAPPKVIILDDPNAIKAAAGTGQVFPIKVTEKPLKQVLDFLSQISRMNIRALREKEEKMLVSMDLESVTYRGVLDYLSKKYGLLIDDSKIDQKLIFVSSPPKVSMIFTRADIRDVINTIAMQAGANIVIGPEVTGEISMRLEDVPWRDALNIVVKTLDFVAVPEANETLRITTPNRLASQLQTRIFRLAYLTPDSAKYVATLTSEFARREESAEAAKAGQTLFDVLTNMKGPEGKLSFLKRGTALIVTDTATKLDTMEMVVKKLDVAPKQIFVSVKIIIITDTDLERLGVDWSNGVQFNLTPAVTGPQATSFPFDVGAGLIRGMLGNWTGALTTFRGLAEINPFAKSTAAQNQAALIGTAGYNSNAGGINSTTTALFEAIRTKTNSKVIQSPQLMTLDNEEATIQVGQLFRYAESFVANTEGGGNVAGFREAAGSPVKLGLQLLIIPHVTGPENNVLMTVIPKTEDLDRIDSFQGGNGLILQLPQTTQRIVVTRMLLRSNETGVIAGLRINRDRRVESAVPIFSEIPIIGRLFRHRIHDGGVALGTGQPTSESLMVFVTPTILDIDVRDDFKSQLESIRSEVSHSFAPVGGEEISPTK